MGQSDKQYVTCIIATHTCTSCRTSLYRIKRISSYYSSPRRSEHHITFHTSSHIISCRDKSLLYTYHRYTNIDQWIGDSYFFLLRNILVPRTGNTNILTSNIITYRLSRKYSRWWSIGSIICSDEFGYCETTYYPTDENSKQRNHDLFLHLISMYRVKNYLFLFTNNLSFSVSTSTEWVRLIRLIHKPTISNKVHHIWYIYNCSCKNTYAKSIHDIGHNRLIAHTNDTGAWSIASYRKYSDKTTGNKASHTKYIHVSPPNQIDTSCWTWSNVGTTKINTSIARPYLSKITISGETSSRYFLYKTVPHAEHKAATATRYTPRSIPTPKENHLVVIYVTHKNINQVHTSHWIVQRSFNHKNPIIHIKRADNLIVIIALIAVVWLNHFIYSKGAQTQENTAIHKMGIKCFFGIRQSSFNSGTIQKNNSIVSTEKICTKSSSVSGKVRCKRYLLKMVYDEPKNTDNIHASTHQKRPDIPTNIPKNISIGSRYLFVKLESNFQCL